MIVSRKNSQSYIVICLFLCILLNYLLLNYLYTHTKSSNLHFNALNKQKHDHLADLPIPLTYELKNIPVLCQLPLLPTGCEATAATMLLQWAGVSVTMGEFADALPKGPLPSLKGGRLVGGNPNKEFVGDPYQTSGLGIYNEPMQEVLNIFLPNEIENLTGCSFDELLLVISSERPILVWATIGMAKPSINSTWVDAVGNEVVWKIPE
ncbi:MAG: C39 family peptidase, partial [Vallitaleaceae bacterium]|nr:C39 family peptidase [Vallitaleaceae bacterium]